MHRSKKSYSLKNNHFRGFLAISVLATISFSCKKREFNNSSTHGAKSASTDVAQGTKFKWNEYIKTIKFAELQKECYPRRYPAKGKYKGVAVFYHGFSACPQQFWDLANLVSAAGYEVYLPLLPGHGIKKHRAPSNDNTRQNAAHSRSQETIRQLDDISHVPRREDWTRYSELSDLMTKIVRFEPGERLMAGLSVGGALATHSTLSELYPGTWTRSLILAPMFELLDGPMNQVPEVLGAIPIVKGSELSWGEGCDKDSLEAPNVQGNTGFVRGGYCNFKIEHLNAISWFGKQSLNLIRNAANSKNPYAEKVNVQLVNVDIDGKTHGNNLVAARNHFNTILNRSVKDEKSLFKFSSCSYGNDVPHSMISRYDEPEVNGQGKKVWLNSLLAEATGYLAQGTAFKENGASPVINGYPGCVIDQAAPDIPWSSPKTVQDDDGNAARLEALYPL